MQVHCKIRGIEPGLMMNSLNGYGQDIPKEIKAKGIKTLGAWYETDRSAAEKWAADFSQYYSDRLKCLVIPQDVISGAFLKACSGIKVKIGSRNHSANTIFPSVLTFNQTETPLLDLDGKPITKYTHVINKFVRVPPRTGARVPKTWAGVYPWQAEVVIDCAPSMSKGHIDTAKEVMVIAGQYVGIMDGRPALKRFNYGRFDVIGWEVKEEKLAAAAD